MSGKRGRHVRLSAFMLAVATLALLAQPLRAQETLRADTASRIPHMVGGGLVGGVLGVPAGMIVGGFVEFAVKGFNASRVGESGEVAGLLALQPVATAAGVHWANRKRGNFKSAVKASFAATGAAVGVAVFTDALGVDIVSDNPAFLIGILAAQTAAATYVEVRDTRRKK